MYLSQNDEQNHNRHLFFRAAEADDRPRVEKASRTDENRPASLKPKHLTAADERSLVWRWQRRKDHKARDALVRAFQPAIIAFAEKYPGRGLDRDDRISLGNIGFLIALDKFNIKLRWRLWTYAKHWVRAEIGAATEKSRSIVVRPRQVNRSEKGAADLSLNAPVGVDGAEYVDLLFDGYSEHEARHFNNDSLASALELLKPRERAIFAARRLSDEPEKLSALAIQFQISSERVRQIEDAALAIVSARMTEAENGPSPQFARQMASETFSGRGHKLCYSRHRWPEFRDQSPASNRERLR